MPRKHVFQWRSDAALPEQEPSPSRSAKKRHARALQELGMQFARLEPSVLSKLNLPPELLEALTMYAAITDREGSRRQMQYIGRLMRGIDAMTLQAACDALRIPQKHAQDLTPA